MTEQFEGNPSNFRTPLPYEEKNPSNVTNNDPKDDFDFKGVNPSDFRTPLPYETKEAANPNAKESPKDGFDFKGVNPSDFRTPLPYEVEKEGAEDDSEAKDLSTEASERLKALREELNQISEALEELTKRVGEITEEIGKIQAGEALQEEGSEGTEASEETADDQEDLYETPAYKTVMADREVYLTALAKRRKWFRRGSKNGVEELREKYSESLGKFISERVTAMKAEGLTEEEINHQVSKLLVLETYERTNQEVELANNKKTKRIHNWIKNHPKTRMLIGGLMSAGAIGTGALGMLPLSAVFLAGRTAFAGAGTAMFTEGVLDRWGEKRSRKHGDLSGTSKEDIDKIRASGDAIMFEVLDKKLAAQLANSVRKGKMVENENTVDILVEKQNQFERDMAALTANGETADSVRATLVEAAVRSELIAIENAQARERTRSIQRCMAAGALGLVASGVTLGRGVGNIRAAQEAALTDKPSLASPQPPVTEAPPVRSLQEQINGYSVTEVARPGDGNWMLSERGLHSFMDQFGLHDLTPNQQIIATDYIKDQLGEGWLQVGETKKIPGSLINSAYQYAKVH